MESSNEFIPVYPASLVTQITQFLTNAIIEGRLKEGERLIENELQRKFGISRAPIRESFRILEKNGLVITIPRKGTFVRKITQKDIEEIFPIIALLEGLAARLAVSQLENDDIEEMKLALTKMTDAAEKKDFESYINYHTEYHEIFIYASKNETLIGLLENLRRQNIWFRSAYRYVQESFEYTLRVHREIIDLFIKKDAERLEALVNEHIIFAFHRLVHFLGSKNEEKMER